MENLSDITGGKYEFIDNKINSGAFSKIYEVSKNEIVGAKNKKSNCNANYIVKVQEISDRYEAVNEIKFLSKIKKNRNNYFNSITKFNIEYSESSKIIDIEDYYSDRKNVYIIFKKYETTLDDFNILYHKTFNETLPENLINKFINSLFLGLYELKLSQIIHCDVKPNNIMITNNYGKNIINVLKDIKKNKLKKSDLVKFLDIVFIDFNLSQKNNAICKSIKIQTTYYMAPEIILGDTNFNFSIDIWSVGCIIYELLTGKFLFDINNYNERYGEHFNNYNFSNISSESSDYYSYYSNSGDSDNIVLLYLYRELFGDNPFISSNCNNLNYYYYSSSNNSLLNGTVKFKESSNQEFIQFIKKNINSVKYINLFSKIFTYDYNNRLTPEDYFK